MKTLYIECNMGAAGDMLMAALLELHPDADGFLARLNAVGIPGVTVTREAASKCGIKGTYVRVEIGGHEEHDHEDDDDHHHHHHTHDSHSHNHSDNHAIGHLIDHLDISAAVKNHARAVYALIAEAESHAHGVPVSQIHFHEVGEMDAVADIVGVCMLIEELAPAAICASPVHVGSGQVRCAHGILPVPAPATAHILTGIPTYGGDIGGELCTPTGAALLRHFAASFGPMPEMTTDKIGYGMGKKDFPAANCVRVFYGTGRRPDGVTGEKVAELSCNIDDMTGEALGYACGLLLEAGARDVFTLAAAMKKGRPGQLLVCVCDVERADDFAALILKHTTTFGVRKAILERYTLARRIDTVATPYGDVRIKTGRGYGVEKSKPEYDDTAALASRHGCSFMEMERRIWNKEEEPQK